MQVSSQDLCNRVMDLEITERLQICRVSGISADNRRLSEEINGASITATKSQNSLFMDEDDTLPRAHFVKVPHVEQLCSWDCGLACVLMILKTLGIEGQDIKSLGKLCCTSSIWTVDLAHLLRHFDLDVIFLTVTIGANPNYVDETFYKENMEEDGVRVNRLFAKAADVGIQIQRRSISSLELSKLILSGRYLAIALVDKRELSYSWFEDFFLSDFCLTTGYIGHYVVICGYDMDLEEFEIQDPACSSGCTRIPSKTLDKARTTFGTDEDILLILMHSHDKAS